MGVEYDAGTLGELVVVLAGGVAVCVESVVGGKTKLLCEHHG